MTTEYELILLKALDDIKAFGYANSGKGYSCAKMAEAAIKEYHDALSVGRDVTFLNTEDKNGK